MKLLQTVAVFGLITLLFGTAATGALARTYQEQSQSSSQSYSFSSKCSDGDCGSASFKSKSKLKQSQSTGGYTNKWDSNTSRWQRNSHQPKYGNATLVWDHRGGTCHVRYSESSVQGYKYFTTAACDNGEVVIGGLQKGTTYRFQVMKENQGWSKPVWLRAS